MLYTTYHPSMCYTLHTIHPCVIHYIPSIHVLYTTYHPSMCYTLHTIHPCVIHYIPSIHVLYTTYHPSMCYTLHTIHPCVIHYIPSIHVLYTTYYADSHADTQITCWWHMDMGNQPSIEQSTHAHMPTKLRRTDLLLLCLFLK